MSVVCTLGKSTDFGGRAFTTSVKWTYIMVKKILPEKILNGTWGWENFPEFSFCCVGVDCIEVVE